MEKEIAKSKNTKISYLIGAVGGIIGGFFLMLTGLILSAVSFIDKMSFLGFEVFLLAAAFVLVTIGSHFLDLIEKEKKAK
ncbi:MAG: hypothetical protein LH614_21520 [Pyrinomonadaceae bacterium]|nr:hypothetical protein [Pyrinomonadaceae bacterium]